MTDTGAERLQPSRRHQMLLPVGRLDLTAAGAVAPQHAPTERAPGVGGGVGPPPHAPPGVVLGHRPGSAPDFEGRVCGRRDAVEVGGCGDRVCVMPGDNQPVPLSGSVTFHGSVGAQQNPGAFLERVR